MTPRTVRMQRSRPPADSPVFGRLFSEGELSRRTASADPATFVCVQDTFAASLFDASMA
jgi:hypothetical protein